VARIWLDVINEKPEVAAHSRMKRIAYGSFAPYILVTLTGFFVGFKNPVLV